MALEKSLWKRVKDAGAVLKNMGHGVHMKRTENAVGVGDPDVNGCIDGVQVWLELKSEHRPARLTTPIRPKVRVDQEIWLRERIEAGCRTAWVLIQVGDAALARLYLIPGDRYSDITTTEARLHMMSFIDPAWPMPRVLRRAASGW